MATGLEGYHTVGGPPTTREEGDAYESLRLQRGAAKAVPRTGHPSFCFQYTHSDPSRESKNAMQSQTIDYQAVINDLEQKRAAMNIRFDAAIAALRQVMALERTGVQPILPGIPVATLPTAAGNDQPYKGLSMIDAAIQHIRWAGGGVPNMRLARELERGGYHHRSKNFPNTLNSVLWRRHKTIGDVRKTQQGWEVVDAGNN